MFKNWVNNSINEVQTKNIVVKLNIEIHELRQKVSEREDDGKKTRNEDALKISIDNAQQ